jgi:hypothetical protein
MHLNPAMKKNFISLLIVISFYGCEKEKPIEYSSSLIGEWEWLISCGGVAGCWSPFTSHYTMKYVFTIDSVFEYYKNDTLRSSNRFYTYIQVSEDLKDTSNIINLGSSTAKYIIYQDTLNLLSLNFFNAGSAFKRIK